MSGVGKYVEQQELSSVMGGNADWYRHILAISKKMDIHILWLTDSIPRCIPREIHTYMC